MAKMVFVKASLAMLGICVQFLCAQEHRFDIRDSIEMTTFNSPSELESNSKPIWSPNGNQFLVVTSHGLVGSNQIESVLGIYDTKTVHFFLDTEPSGSELKPMTLVTIRGVPLAETLDSYDSLITDVRWSSDGRTIYFRMQASNGYRLLYRVDARGGAAYRLTPYGYDVQEYDIAQKMVACTLSRPMNRAGDDQHLLGDPINRDAIDVTGVPLANILFPYRKDIWGYPRVSALWVSRKDGQGHILSQFTSSQVDNSAVGMLSLSPTGHWAVRLLPVHFIPESWERYEPSPLFPYLRINSRDASVISPSNVMRLREYVLINMNGGPNSLKAAFYLDAPNARPLGLGIVDLAVWSPDESRLLLSNTFLSLSGVDEGRRSQRLHACVVASVEVSSQKVRCVTFSSTRKSNVNETSEPPYLRDVAFGKDKNEVILRYKGLLGTLIERYQLSGVEWVLTESSISDNSNATRMSSAPIPACGASTNGLEVTIRQTLNLPPVLWVKDLASGKSRPLWNPNRQLAKMKLGDASIYRWKDKTGYEWAGGLIKPVDYVSGERYPLVIQTHGFQNNVFKVVTDGAFPTAMAARPLASAGIMVLQIPDRPGKDFVTSEEADRQIGGYVSAIEQLDSEGFVDPKRVGIIGFSRTCWYVESALIKYPKVFAAATIADGVDESYMQYHLDPGYAHEFETINQGKPFGEEGIRKWIQLAPGFHLDRVNTPLRIEAIDPISILHEWEIYSSLRLQDKPVDLVYIPDGQHILQKPLDRMASQQGNVDWFRFWLQGYERPNPEDPGQYKRWEHLRELQDAEVKAAGIANPTKPQ